MDGERPGVPAPWRPFVVAPRSGGAARVEAVASEEPLELRVRGTPFAVLLRTPGRERDLIAGFLAAERVVGGPDDLAALEPCPDPDSGASANVWNAALAEGVAFDPRTARPATVGSACGLCGARTIETLRAGLPRPAQVAEPDPRALERAFESVRARQPLFARTGGCHGAALAAPRAGGSLEVLDVAEDVGRHNAADKVIGASLRSGRYPLEEPTWLLVSGRVSYEIVQKAALAGIGGVAGVGMPSSLAVEAARACGLRLHAFVRPGAGHRYAPAPGEAEAGR